jgi:hypothetical protein
MAFFIRPGRLDLSAVAITWATFASLLTAVAITSSCSSDKTSGGGSTTGSSTGDDTPLPPILDAGGPLPDPVDGAGLCLFQTSCNYQTGEHCQPTETCAPVATDAGVTAQCVAAGTTPLGGACSAAKFYGECQPGAVCVKDICRKLCCAGDWNGCPSGQRCVAPLEVNTMASPTAVMSGAWLCLPPEPCDPLDPVASCSGTGAGNVCIIADDLGSTICNPPTGKGHAEESCPCDVGFTCITPAQADGGISRWDDGGPASVCRRLCLAVEGGGEPSCPREEGECAHFLRDPPNVGECTPLTVISN